ncbi:hypothetical protein IQ254_06330 [Nodosilinea sp. LEGE 07088]|uniref:hypothetical protein n=1 Tax=Nodosilinea sp. LEGE 07088 TaxID=2777968 RepID=UPI00187EC6A4|nr:hypothetical protein [Nodosilinea sp. LEGE 07088]MBE9136824.1 hypothetical protein [Nodosilinea sp. LEGE 07088]
MPQLTQGLIVAGLIGLLLAVIVGYYLRQGQINELTETLQRSQKRQEDLAVEHEQRLRDATQQLQKDYEAQLSEKMEQYQIQLEEQRSRLESEYRARQGMEGVALAEVDSLTEQRIRKQYETRLKEAAAKIQQAYEQHLQAKLAAARSHPQPEDNPQRINSPASVGLEATNLAALEERLQADYDRRLAERIAEYQDDMTQRMAQLEQEYEARLQMAQPTASPELAPTPSELELNLRRELEASLREEYDQRLAAEIEHYQNQLAQRTQELDQSYEALQTSPVTSSSPIAEELITEGLIAEALITAESELDLGINAELNTAEMTDPAASRDSLGFDELEDDVSSDLSLDLSPEADSMDSAADGDLNEWDSELQQQASAENQAEDTQTSSLDVSEVEANDAGLADLSALLNDQGENTAADDIFGSADDALGDLGNETVESFDLETLSDNQDTQDDDIFGLSGGTSGSSDELNFDALLDDNPPAGDIQDDMQAFDTDFGAEAELDLEALLNAPDTDNVSDEQLEGLDDISDLS